MCLSGIEKRGLRLSGIGWKVFEIFGTSYVSKHIFNIAVSGQKLQNVYNLRDNAVSIGRWLTAKRKSVKAYGQGKPFMYLSGFHILLRKPSKETARNHACGGNIVIRKVKFKRGRIIGYQFGTDKIVVADDMLVLPVKNSK